MLFSNALAAAAAVALVNAHGKDFPIPQIAGLNVKDLKTRDMLSNMRARMAEIQEAALEQENERRGASSGGLKNRQNGGTTGQCGPGFGTCDPGYCCSQAGWCGNTPDYCYSPGCIYQYGPGCPENQTPAGTNTSSVPRPKLGSVQYGGNGIYDCVVPGTVALTFDDGPQKNYTSHILDIFKSYNAVGSFMITGNNINKGQIDITPEFVSDIQRMHADGHQITSHTWTHLDLSAISKQDRYNQMYKNEMALRNILGFFPTYMRPPYSSCTAASGCEKDMADLGYHVTYFDIDTDDYDQDAPNLIQNSKNWYYGNMTAGGATSKTSDWLVIGHDIHEQTAYNLTDYMLSTLTQLGYKPVTVGECLGDPAANWYRTSEGAGTAPVSSSAPSTPTSTSTPPSATLLTPDATCGGTTGYTCQGSTFGNCCSAAGWCGSTSDYCGAGCQTGFGTCGSNSPSSSSPSSSAIASVASVPKSSSTLVKSSSTKPASSAKPTSTKASSTKVSSSAPKATAKLTTDATCGGKNGYTCQGSQWGNCCSVNGWCGSTSAYCGSGCQKGFGTCT